MAWRMMAAGRSMPDDIEQEIEAAYKEGCEHGYEKAMEEMQDGQSGKRYGERGNGNYPVYNGRRHEDGYDGRSDGYGERRRHYRMR